MTADTSLLARMIADLPDGNPFKEATRRMCDQVIDLLGDLVEDRIVVDGREVAERLALPEEGAAA